MNSAGGLMAIVSITKSMASQAGGSAISGGTSKGSASAGIFGSSAARPLRAKASENGFPEFANALRENAAPSASKRNPPVAITDISVSGKSELAATDRASQTRQASPTRQTKEATEAGQLSIVFSLSAPKEVGVSTLPELATTSAIVTISTSDLTKSTVVHSAARLEGDSSLDRTTGKEGSVVDTKQKIDRQSAQAKRQAPNHSLLNFCQLPVWSLAEPANPQVRSLSPDLSPVSPVLHKKEEGKFSDAGTREAVSSEAAPVSGVLELADSSSATATESVPVSAVPAAQPSHLGEDQFESKFVLKTVDSLAPKVDRAEAAADIQRSSADGEAGEAAFRKIAVDDSPIRLPTIGKDSRRAVSGDVLTGDKDVLPARLVSSVAKTSGESDQALAVDSSQKPVPKYQMLALDTVSFRAVSMGGENIGSNEDSSIQDFGGMRFFNDEMVPAERLSAGTPAESIPLPQVRESATAPAPEIARLDAGKILEKGVDVLLPSEPTAMTSGLSVAAVGVLQTSNSTSRHATLGAPPSLGAPVGPGSLATNESHIWSPSMAIAPVLAQHFGETSRSAPAEASGESHDFSGFSVGKLLMRMDSGIGPVTARVSTQSIAVGVDDPTHGWIEVRAQGAPGQVTASLAVDSPEVHAALRAQLPALAQYLTEHNLAVNSMEVSSARAMPDHAGGSLSGRGFGESSGGGSGGMPAEQGGAGSFSGSTGDSHKGGNAGEGRLASQLPSAMSRSDETNARVVVGDFGVGGGMLINVQA